MLSDFVSVCSDDIFMFSKDEKERVHMLHALLLVWHVPQCLRDNQLYIEVEKCERHQKSIPFPGFII